MDKAISSAKGKFYSKMSDEEKRAFVEAVCIRVEDMVLRSTSGSSTRNFFKYWGEQILKITPSASKYLDKYFYEVKDHVCALSIVTNDGELIDVSNNLKELKLFVYNVVNEVPLHSPIVENVKRGMSKQEIVDAGVDSLQYGSTSNVKTSKARPDSLRQKILRGELTRYEAYEKPRKEKDKLTGKKEN